MQHHVRRPAFTLIELLVVIAVIAILIGLLLPATQQVRSLAIRSQCQNNLKSIGAACQSYHFQYKRFPKGCEITNDIATPQFLSANQSGLSWLARILPFIDQESLADTIPGEYARCYSPWGFAPTGQYRPHVGLGTQMPLYRCPHESRQLINDQVMMPTGLTTWYMTTVAFTSYLGNSGTKCGMDDGVLFDRSAVKLDMISDGASNTLLAGERPPSADLNFGWWYAGAGYYDPTFKQVGVGDVVLGARETVYASDPYNQLQTLQPTLGFTGTDCSQKVNFQPGNVYDPCDQVHFWSEHPGGANFVFCDGAVRFLAYDVDKILPALATRAGEEMIGNLD